MGTKLENSEIKLKPKASESIFLRRLDQAQLTVSEPQTKLRRTEAQEKIRKKLEGAQVQTKGPINVVSLIEH